MHTRAQSIGQHRQAGLRTSSRPGSDTPAATIPPTDRHTTRAAQFVARWQPAMSLAVVVAVLIGLVGVAWTRGVWNDTGNPMGQVAASPDENVYACKPQSGVQRSDAELMTMHWTDWQSPAYVVPLAGWTDDAKAASDDFFNYLSCFIRAQQEGTPAAAIDSSPYYSDRLRYVLMYDQLSPDRQAELDQAFQYNPIPRLVSDFPLPVNRASWTSSDDDPESYFGYFLAPWELYLLPDGRMGGFIGSVSAHMLQTGTPIRTDDGLVQWIAFAKQGDGWFIDEWFAICPEAFAPGALEDGGATESQSHDPAGRLRSDGGC
jgi:hypothetical protein